MPVNTIDCMIMDCMIMIDMIIIIDGWMAWEYFRLAFS